MKIEPVITKRICTKHTSFEVDLQIENNVTLISGDSGTGKSALFSFLQELAVEDKQMRCFNYLDKKKLYKNSIKQSKGKLYIIDNADILLDDNIRSYIALDEKNQYIIIGRNPTGLLLNMDEIYELKNETVNDTTVLTLQKSF